MAVTSYTRSFDDIGSTTLELVRPKIADAIFDANPFFRWLRSRGRVSVESGGRHIETRVKYAKNTTVASYKGYEDLNAAPQEHITAAIYSWRQYAGSVTISGFEEAVNSGESQLINLLRTELEILEMSFRDLMAEHLFAASANKDLTRDITGLQEIVENAAAASQGVLGGIAKATYAWWRNQRDTLDYQTVVSGGDTRPLYTKFTEMLNETQQQLIPSSDMLMVTSQRVFEKFEFENRDLLQFMPRDLSSLDVGEPGDSRRFKGVKMIWDPKCPIVGTGEGTSGLAGHHVYFLAAPFLDFVVHRNRNFATTPFRTPVKQDAKVAYMLFMGNLTSSNNRHHGVLSVYNLDA